MNGTRRQRGLLRTLILLGLVVVSATPGAQGDERYRGRLSVLPVDVATLRTMSGSGEVRATLEGRSLVVSGSFEGLSSPATVAHIHEAPPARRGPVAFAIDVNSATGATSGEVTGTVELDDAQTRALRNHEYYVQIHTEHNAGGEIRGWLMRVR